MEKIRVGIINCDTHGLWYGAQMGDHDPYQLRALAPGIHFYFYTAYGEPERMTAPFIEGFEIVKIWDKSSVAAERFPKIFHSRPKVCATFEEVSTDVDLVFLADCNGDGKDHLQLASPGLVNSVPTFIDKPLAYDTKDAQAIVELARKHNAPILSLSILRTLPHASRFARRFSELDSVHFAIVKGGGTTLAGQIHAISLAQHLFGAGVESVDAMGRNELGFVHLNYAAKDGFPKCGVTLNCDVGGTYHCSMYASAFGPLGAIHSPNLGDYEFPWGSAEILRLVFQMVRSRCSPVPYEEMIENIAVADAARRAQVSGKTVRLADVLR